MNLLFIHKTMETMNWLLCIFYVLANIRTMMLHIQVQPSFPSSAGFILSSFFSLNCCCLRGSRLVAAATMLLRYSSPFLFFFSFHFYIYTLFSLFWQQTLLQLLRQPYLMQSSVNHDRTTWGSIRAKRVFRGTPFTDSVWICISIKR